MAYLNFVQLSVFFVFSGEIIDQHYDRSGPQLIDSLEFPHLLCKPFPTNFSLVQVKDDDIVARLVLLNGAEGFRWVGDVVHATA